MCILISQKPTSYSPWNIFLSRGVLLTNRKKGRQILINHDQKPYFLAKVFATYIIVVL